MDLKRSSACHSIASIENQLWTVDQLHFGYFSAFWFQFDEHDLLTKLPTREVLVGLIFA